MFYLLLGRPFTDASMYSILLPAHSFIRWLLLAALITSIARAYVGRRRLDTFTKWDDALRHWTATIAHIQLMAGIFLYTQSPVVRSFWSHFRQGIHDRDNAFFGLIHMLLMLLAISLITIGAALAKRRVDDAHKFRTMLWWFGAGLLIVLIAIPWPFSPLAQRPYFR